MLNLIKQLINSVLRVFGYKIKLLNINYLQDLTVNHALHEARSTILAHCPHPQYVESYHQHEVGAWGPIPALLYAQKPRELSTLKVLDIGCAFGTLLAYCSNLGFKTYGIDFVPQDLYLGISIRDKYQIDYFQLNVEKDSFPFADGEMDIVVMTEVLEHLHFQPLDVLNKIGRVLKRGGLFLLTTPALGRTWPPAHYACPFEAIPSYSDPYYEFTDKHMKIYAKEELLRLLMKAGFDPYVGVHINPSTELEHLHAVALKV